MLRTVTSRSVRLALCSALALASCEAAGTMAGGGPQSDYLVARQALETGNYDIAIRHYARLIESVDANSAARLQLEYAHALLRANQYFQAITVADVLIQRHDGSIRASALAVRGTARHEAARERLAAGLRDGDTRALLVSAQNDINAFVAQEGTLDSTGSMRARASLITQDLQSV
ncbi:hypothetical protein [Pararhodobacter marinus]|nr:hypothetical protein [Pararhodobacter marinus]